MTMGKLFLDIPDGIDTSDQLWTYVESIYEKWKVNNLIGAEEIETFCNTRRGRLALFWYLRTVGAITDDKATSFGQEELQGHFDDMLRKGTKRLRQLNYKIQTRISRR